MARLSYYTQQARLQDHIDKYGGITTKYIEEDLSVTPTVANALFNTITNAITTETNHIGRPLFVTKRVKNSKKPVRVMPYDLYRANVNWYFEPVSQQNQIIDFITAFVEQQKQKLPGDCHDALNRVLADITKYRETCDNTLTIMTRDRPALLTAAQELSQQLQRKYPTVKHYRIYDDDHQLSGIAFVINPRKDDPNWIPNR